MPILKSKTGRDPIKRVLEEGPSLTDKEAKEMKKAIEEAFEKVCTCNHEKKFND